MIEIQALVFKDVYFEYQYQANEKWKFANLTDQFSVGVSQTQHLTNEKCSQVLRNVDLNFDGSHAAVIFGEKQLRF